MTVTRVQLSQCVSVCSSCTFKCNYLCISVSMSVSVLYVGYVTVIERWIVGTVMKK